MPQRQIGPFHVSAIGLGCMNLSHAYGVPPSPEAGRELLARALDLGCTLFDTAALYGFGANESLVGPVLKPHRSKITLCSKGGMAGVQFPDGVKRVIDGRPEEPGHRAVMSEGGRSCPGSSRSVRWPRPVPAPRARRRAAGAETRARAAGRGRRGRRVVGSSRAASRVGGAARA